MLRRTPLAQVSPKRRAERHVYEWAIRAVWRRDAGECQGACLWPDIECGGRLDPHHIYPTGRYPERRCDPDAMVLLCRRHHDAVHHLDPVRARQLGLLV